MMRSTLFVNYWPIGNVGAKVPPKTSSKEPEDVPWLPSPIIKHYEVRTVNGKVETRPTPGYLPTKQAGPFDKPEVKRDPPFLPEGFKSFEYHGADGKVSKFKGITSDDCAAQEVGAAAVVETSNASPVAAHPVPYGATHTTKPAQAAVPTKDAVTIAYIGANNRSRNYKLVLDVFDLFRDGCDSLPESNYAACIEALNAIGNNKVAMPTENDLQAAWDKANFYSAGKALKAINQFVAGRVGHVVDLIPPEKRSEAIAALDAIGAQERPPSFIGRLPVGCSNADGTISISIRGEYQRFG